MHGGTLSSVPGAHSVDARSNPFPDCDNQECLQMQPILLLGGGGNYTRVRTTDLENYYEDRRDGAFPGGSVVRKLPVNAGDTGLIPGSERSPGEGNGNPL